MSKRSVFGIAPSRGRADRLLHDLKEADFANTDISVLFLDPSGSDQRNPANVASASAGVSSARSSGAIRGVVAWIHGVRSLDIPGVEPLIAAGLVAAALSGATVGGVAGGLIDFGLPASEAGRYETRIKDGQFLISVHSENPEKSDQARAIFTSSGAEDICTIIEVITPKFPFRNAY